MNDICKFYKSPEVDTYAAAMTAVAISGIGVRFYRPMADVMPRVVIIGTPLGFLAGSIASEAFYNTRYASNECFQCKTVSADTVKRIVRHTTATVGASFLLQLLLNGTNAVAPFISGQDTQLIASVGLGVVSVGLIATSVSTYTNEKDWCFGK